MRTDWLVREHARLREAFPFVGTSFDEAALAVFHFQAKANPVYAQWLAYLKIDSERISDVGDIPYLPVGQFKQKEVTSLPHSEAVHRFLSSRTTGQTPSQHLVYDFAVYEKASKPFFEAVFGPVTGYYFLSLLPRYATNGQSSLVWMVNFLAKEAGQTEAKSIAMTQEALMRGIEEAEQSGTRPLLFGVTHALLALAEQGPVNAPFLLVETGGMKGQGVELTRAEVHACLASTFPNADIRSEYGMTELFSQGYTQGSQSEDFLFPPWVRASLRDTSDPLAASPRNRGVLNLIDLANIDSCAFIATEDLAEQTAAGFRILGRADHAEIRGCNLLML